MRAKIQWTYKAGQITAGSGEGRGGRDGDGKARAGRRFRPSEWTRRACLEQPKVSARKAQAVNLANDGVARNAAQLAGYFGSREARLPKRLHGFDAIISPSHRNVSEEEQA